MECGRSPNALFACYATNPIYVRDATEPNVRIYSHVFKQHVIVGREHREIGSCGVVEFGESDIEVSHIY